MKKIIFIFLIFLSPNLFSQDIIIKIDGIEIESKVIEITTEIIKYKKFNHLDGPIRNIKISDVFYIIYENGEREKFTAINTQNLKTNNSDNDKVEIKVNPDDKNEVENNSIEPVNENISASNEEPLIEEKETIEILQDEVNSAPIKALDKNNNTNTSTTTNTIEPRQNVYNGKYTLTCIGYGNSYGGLGVKFQGRRGQKQGVGMHIGIGYFPYAKYLASIGVNLYLYKNLYLNAQWGRTGWEELSTYTTNFTTSNSTYESHVLKGYSFMLGSNWFWGKKQKVGLNWGIGITHNVNVEYFPELINTLAIDIGLFIK